MALGLPFPNPLRAQLCLGGPASPCLCPLTSDGEAGEAPVPHHVAEELGVTALQHAAPGRPGSTQTLWRHRDPCPWRRAEACGASRQAPVPAEPCGHSDPPLGAKALEGIPPGPSLPAAPEHGRGHCPLTPATPEEVREQAPCSRLSSCPLRECDNCCEDLRCPPVTSLHLSHTAFPHGAPNRPPARAPARAGTEGQVQAG